MDATFEVFWGALKLALSKTTPIRNWTVDSEYLGEDFSAQAQGNAIYCDPPGVNVSRDDFWKIWQFWDQYLTGSVKRQVIRDLPHYNTKYVISILHHFMESADSQ